MRNHALRLLLCVAASAAAAPATAQVKPDSGARDSARPRMRVPAGMYARPRLVQSQAPSLNPDISAIGELLTDLSPGSAKTTSNGERFEVREVELGVQAVVDPFFRADFFLGLHPDAFEIEEAFLTALALPAGLQARLGRFRVPLGKVNLIHRPELLTIDYPWMIREFLGDEGLSSSGIGLSRIFAPFGFFQEIVLYAVSNIGREAHDHDGHEEEFEFIEANDADDIENQIALGGQLRSFWDLSTATNLEAGLSGAIGQVRAFEPECTVIDPCPPLIPRETFVGQSYYGAYLTLRWRPPERSLYRSLIWNNEILVSDGHHGTRFGAFSQAQYQISRRGYLGARFDAVQRFLELETDDDVIVVDEDEKDWFYAASGYLTFFPSEFSRFKLGLERTFGEGAFGREWRLVLQTTFAIGPHRPHAF